MAVRDNSLINWGLPSEQGTTNSQYQVGLSTHCALANDRPTAANNGSFWINTSLVMNSATVANSRFCYVLLIRRNSDGAYIGYIDLPIDAPTVGTGVGPSYRINYNIYPQSLGNGIPYINFLPGRDASWIQAGANYNIQVELNVLYNNTYYTTWSKRVGIYTFHNIRCDDLAITGNNTTLSPQNASSLTITGSLQNGTWTGITYGPTGSQSYNENSIYTSVMSNSNYSVWNSNLNYALGSATNSNFTSIFGNSADSRWNNDSFTGTFYMWRKQQRTYNSNPVNGYSGITNFNPTFVTQDYTHYSSLNLTLQLKPTKSPNNYAIWDSNNTDITSTVKGHTINGSVYPTIKLKWDYPYNEMAAGLINGYRLRIYSDSTYTTLFKEFDIETTNYTSVTKELTTAADLPIGIMCYAEITPYYKDNAGTKRYGNLSLRDVIGQTLLKPDPVVINYPINNTTWHNRQFRILLTLPDYPLLAGDSGVFEDLEVNINGTPYCFTDYPQIYSTDTISYNKKIVVNPSLLTSFTNQDTYVIKARVTKLKVDDIWSDWSSAVTLNREDLTPIEAGGEDYPLIYEELNEILGESDSYTGPGDTNINIYNELNVVVGESDPYSGGTSAADIVTGGIILASHFNTIRNYSVRLYNVYPIVSLDSDNIEAARGEKILHSNYLGMYRTIKNIQSSVNTWATFDSNHQDVKFNETIDLLDNPNQPIRGEIITADRDLRPGSGRNYLLALFDCMNLLR